MLHFNFEDKTLCDSSEAVIFSVVVVTSKRIREMLKHKIQSTNTALMSSWSVLTQSGHPESPTTQTIFKISLPTFPQSYFFFETKTIDMGAQLAQIYAKEFHLPGADFSNPPVTLYWHASISPFLFQPRCDITPTSRMRKAMTFSNNGQ